MKLNRKIQIHMLPTEDESNIVKLNSGNILYNYREPVKAQKPHYTNQYLYITTDEKVKDGDWYYSTFPHNRGVNQRKGNWRTCFNERKIIATTDTKLTVNYKGYEYGTAREYSANIYLPQPPQSFVEAFCKAGGIENVLVEYDVIHADRAPNGFEHILKVNSHNEITIHTIKSSWDREEVIELLRGYANCTSGNECRLEEVDKWIKENL